MSEAYAISDGGFVAAKPPSVDYDSIIIRTKAHVQQYMLRYDSSHDYDHIKRVLNLALYLYKQESRRHYTASTDAETTDLISPPYNRTLIVLAALLHDIGDRKYHTTADDPTRLAQNFLLSVDCPPAMAEDVQAIVNHVSYSHEIKNRAVVASVLAKLPELGIVQDADRLDAIGAVGVGRTFTYGASVRCMKLLELGRKGEMDGHAAGLSSSMDNSIEHFVDKLEKLEGMMKTRAGSKLARQKTERLKVFRGWWEEELGIVDGEEVVNV